MRKVCVVLLILAIAGGAFAQGFSFTGYFDGGVGAFIPDSGDAGLGLITRDADVVGGPRVQLNGAFTNEAGNAGINFRIRAQGANFAGTTNASDSINSVLGFFPYAYGWIAPFEGKLRVLGGRVDDGTFGTGDAIVDDDMGERGGFLAMVKPIDILTLGFGAYTRDSFSGTGMSGIGDAKYTAGAVVNVPDIIKVTFQYRNRGDGGADVDHRMWAAFNILGLNKLGLKLVVVGKAERLQDFSDNGGIGFYETIGFTKINNLSLNLNLWQVISQTTDNDFSFRAWFWASYALADGKIVPRFDVNYLNAGVANTAMMHFNHRFRPGDSGDRNTITKTTVIDNERGLLNFRPSVGFNLDKTSFIELGYNIDIGLGDSPLAKDVINQAIYVDLKVSF
jgi:hypothetical protein